MRYRVTIPLVIIATATLSAGQQAIVKPPLFKLTQDDYIRLYTIFADLQHCIALTHSNYSIVIQKESPAQPFTYTIEVPQSQKSISSAVKTEEADKKKETYKPDIFCPITTGEQPAHFLFHTPTWMGILHANALYSTPNRTRFMVIPKEHREEVHNLKVNQFITAIQLVGTLSYQLGGTFVHCRFNSGSYKHQWHIHGHGNVIHSPPLSTALRDQLPLQKRNITQLPSFTAPFLDHALTIKACSSPSPVAICPPPSVQPAPFELPPAILFPEIKPQAEAHRPASRWRKSGVFAIIGALPAAYVVHKLIRATL